MRIRLLIAALILIILLLSGWGLWRLFTPRLLGVSPTPGAVQVQTHSQLRLTFTRMLSQESIQSHIRIKPDQTGSLTWEGNTLVFTPSRPWSEEAVVSVQLQAGARAAGFPGLALQEGKSWSFQVGQAMLAYLWPSDGPADLYALNPVNGDVRRLTQNASILDFSLGPNANNLYFSSEVGPSGSRIQRLDLTEGLPEPGKVLTSTLVVDCPQALCQSVLASPDGDWLAYERIPLEGSREPTLGQVWLYSLVEDQGRVAGQPDHTTSYPVWASNGWLAFYDQQAKGYVLYQPPDGPPLILSNQTGEAGAWQPDGSAFVAPDILLEASGSLEPLASSHLIRFNISQGELDSQVDLSHAFDLEDSSPVFSPDGAALVFARRYLDPGRWTPGRQLWRMNTDGSQAQPLTSEAALNHHSFAWKPDGAQIAFVRSDPTQLVQPPELWIIDADGENLLRLVIGGYSPVWIP